LSSGSPEIPNSRSNPNFIRAKEGSIEILGRSEDSCKPSPKEEVLLELSGDHRGSVGFEFKGHTSELSQHREDTIASFLKVIPTAISLSSLEENEATDFFVLIR
jgi:hypothetical protein